MERQRGYYGWVLHGLELYRALGGAGIPTVECFPTASWTRWAGARSRGTTRAAWTSSALTALDLDNLPARTNQDQRDAIAAAVTARLHAEGRTERFGDIVVPLPSRWLAGARGAVGDGRGRA
jgi:predicted nuclease with RNAse H fold